MNKEGKKQKEEISSLTGVVHVLLSHIYIIFFFAVVLGVVFDVFFPSDFFSGMKYQYVGMTMIILGTVIIYWAQSTTSYSKKKVNEEKQSQSERDFNFFFRGPYRYTRNPTNFGLAVMSFGLGFLINSPFSLFFVVWAYMISKLVYVKKQDKILKERYGDVYADYLKKVKDWL